MREKKYLLFFLIVSLLLFSCREEKGRYTQTQEIKRGEWQTNSPLVFRFLISRAHTPYATDLIIRHDNRWQYTQLPLVVELRNTQGVLATDTLLLPLAEKPMKWNGKGIATTQIGFHLTPHLRYPAPGVYTLTLSHTLGKQPLYGIQSISLSMIEDPR